MSALWTRLASVTPLDSSTVSGALIYLLALLLLAGLLSWFIRRTGREALRRDTRGYLDRTTFYFLIQFAQIAVFVIFAILYMHIVPALRSLGTAMLAGVSVSAIIFGLAAQTTMGNFISGINLLVYRPLRVGDRIQISAPTGLETGTVERITLGYTVLVAPDKRQIIVPNSLMVNQVTINLTRTEEDVE